MEKAEDGHTINTNLSKDSQLDEGSNPINGGSIEQGMTTINKSAVM